MKLRAVVGVPALLLLCLMTTGCFGALRSETIVITETADGSQSGADEGGFAVKTIYKALVKEASGMRPLGWADRDALLVQLRTRDGSISLERAAPPYENRLKLRTIGEYAELSPDARFVSYLAETETSLEVLLATIENGAKRTVASLAERQLRSFRSAWSENGRFFAYWLGDLKDQGTGELYIYDSSEGKSARFAVSAGAEEAGATVAAIRIADSGSDAVLIRSSNGGDYRFTLGELSDGSFVPGFSQSLNTEDNVQWMNDDQIAFVDSAGGLYAYDKRNASLTVLAERVGAFRLSRDKQAVAYTRDGDTVFVAELYGNNLLNGEAVYKGLNATTFYWSPDDGKLLLSGKKFYERSLTEPAPVAPEEAAPAQDADNGQLIVIVF